MEAIETGDEMSGAKADKAAPHWQGTRVSERPWLYHERRCTTVVRGVGRNSESDFIRFNCKRQTC